MIIARTYNIDPTAEENLTYVVPLRETPFPGDVIKLRHGRDVRVIRRTFIELTDDADDSVDVELGVRFA